MVVSFTSISILFITLIPQVHPQGEFIFFQLLEYYNVLAIYPN